MGVGSSGLAENKRFPFESDESFRKRVAEELEEFRRKSRGYNRHNALYRSALQALEEAKNKKRGSSIKQHVNVSLDEISGVVEERDSDIEAPHGRSHSSTVKRASFSSRDAVHPPARETGSHEEEAVDGRAEDKDSDYFSDDGEDGEEALPGTQFSFHSVVSWLGGKLPLPGSHTPVKPISLGIGSQGGIFLPHKIGVGSSGEVFQGLIPGKGGRSPPRPIAVKRMVLPAGTPLEVADAIRDTFANEVRVLASFSHENLVSCLGWAADARQEQLFIVYELLEGGTLAQRLLPPIAEMYSADGSSLPLHPATSSKDSSLGSVASSASSVDSIVQSSSPLTPLARLNIALGLARALAYLHGPRYGVREGANRPNDDDDEIVWIASLENDDKETRPPVLHRDIKSGNVGLTHDLVPKLLDCGLSKIRSVDSRVLKDFPGGGIYQQSGSTVVGGVSAFSAISGGGFVGTPGYSPPEVALGMYNTASEVYSFGVIIFELLTGRRVGLRSVGDARRAAVKAGWVNGAECQSEQERLFVSWADTSVESFQSDEGWDGGWPPSLVIGLASLFLRCTEPDDRDRPKGMGYVLAEVASLLRQVQGAFSGLTIGHCILCDDQTSGDKGAWCKAPKGRLSHFVCSGCLQDWAIREMRETVRCPWSAQCGAQPWSIREESFQAQLTPHTAASLASSALSAIESLYAGRGSASHGNGGVGQAFSPPSSTSSRGRAGFNGVWPDVIRGPLGSWRRSHPNALVANISGRLDLKDSDLKHLKGVPYVCMSGCTGLSDAALAFLVGGDALAPELIERAEALGLPVPSTIPPHTLRICGCTQLTDSGLSCLSGIHTFDMSGCSQESIGDEGLLGLGPVKVLRIDRCTQSTITDAGFASLAGSCKELSMRGCCQPTITSRAFSNLRGILHLDMSRCNQSTIGDEAFVNLRGIRTLMMQGCDQSTISDSAFQYLRGIQTLSLHGCDNRVRSQAPDGTILERYTLTDALFSHLRGIKHINIGYCPQFTNHALAQLTGCDTLDISGCRQETITASAMKGLHGVRTLHMKGCRPALIAAARKEGLNVKS